MFNNKKSESPSANGTSSSLSGINSLMKGTQLEGNIRAESDIRIDGTIIGNLECNAKVIIGPTGKLEGDINCKNAMIEGTFKGKITVKELLNVRENAKLEGTIITDKLIVQSGAVFNVACTMNGGSMSGNKTKSKIGEGVSN